MKSKKSGFTLIELLVVISIIGLLFTIVFLGVRNYKQKTRDKVRAADISSLRVALEDYFSANGRYPISSSWSGGCNNANYIPGLSPNYVAVLPHDPNCGTPACIGGTSQDWLYRSDVTGSTYKLLNDGCFETNEFTGSGKEFVDPPRAGYNGAFGSIYTPNSINW